MAATPYYVILTCIDGRWDFAGWATDDLEAARKEATLHQDGIALQCTDYANCQEEAEAVVTALNK